MRAKLDELNEKLRYYREVLPSLAYGEARIVKDWISHLEAELSALVETCWFDR